MSNFGEMAANMLENSEHFKRTNILGMRLLDDICVIKDGEFIYAGEVIFLAKVPPGALKLVLANNDGDEWKYDGSECYHFYREVD